MLELSRCIQCSKLTKETFDGRCRRCFEAKGGLAFGQSERLEEAARETERVVAKLKQRR